MKIKKEQLTKITEQQNQLNDLVTEIGMLETKKHALLHEIAGVNKDIEAMKTELEGEYGAININLKDGTYTKIDTEEEPAIAHV